MSWLTALVIVVLTVWWAVEIDRGGQEEVKERKLEEDKEKFKVEQLGS